MARKPIKAVSREKLGITAVPQGSFVDYRITVALHNIGHVWTVRLYGANEAERKQVGGLDFHWCEFKVEFLRGLFFCLHLQKKDRMNILFNQKTANISFWCVFKP